MYMSDLSVVICMHFTVIVLGGCFCVRVCVCVFSDWTEGINMAQIRSQAWY